MAVLIKSNAHLTKGNLMKTKILSAILATAFLLGAPAMSHAANASQCKDPVTHKFIKCPTTAAAVATPAAATTKCRDSKGKFIKCPTAPTATAKPKQCRDATGKFIKCPA